jgi:hypothetical protein
MENFIGMIDTNLTFQKCWQKSDDYGKFIKEVNHSAYWFTKWFSSRGAILCTKLAKHTVTTVGKQNPRISRNGYLES